MKRWFLTLACAALAQLIFSGCDNKGGGGGDAGSGGNASGGNGGSMNATGGAGGSSSSSSGGMLGNGECRTTADCVEPNPGLCLSPDAPTPCGICYQPPVTCMTDMECANQNPGSICDLPQCGCNGEKECKTGCMSDSECETWEYCSPGNRCLPDVCAADADCESNFKCTSGACGRIACTTDADCSGFCVNGQCYATAGTCMLPPP